MTYTEMTNDQIRAKAPSVFALQPWEGQSAKYRFIPTVTVVDALRDSGFYPVRASQSRTRIPGKSDFTKHCLRFRLRGQDQPSQIGDVIPEIGLTNSHDGTSAYDVFLGLFRLVCSNGMVAAMGQLTRIRARHSGRIDLVQCVIDESRELFGNAPQVLNRVQQWQGIDLDQPEQLALAESASQIIDSAIAFDPKSLLQGRRWVDRGTDDGSEVGRRDLWRTFNVIQENTIRGGLRGRGTTGRRTHTRAIESVDRDLKINRALWTLAEKMAEIKAGRQIGGDHVGN
jgi:hypothetical protein